MRIELRPVICWLTQDSDESYKTGLDETIHFMTAAAQPYLDRFLPGDSQYAAECFAYLTLDSVQHLLLDQYLPVVELSRHRAVPGLWKWWLKQGMTVKTNAGVLEALMPPLPDDAQPGSVRSSAGEYPYTFYRHDTAERRRRWLLYQLKEEVQRTQRKERPLKEESVENLDLFASVPGNADRDLVGADLIRKIAAIAHPDDIRAAMYHVKNAPDKMRQEKTRAMRRLFAAGQILQGLPDHPVAAAYFNLLCSVPAKDKKRILKLYFTRFCKELWRDLKEKWKAGTDEESLD